MWLNPALLYARSHGGTTWILGLVALSVASVFVPEAGVHVPLHTMTRTHLVPLLATLPGLLLAASLTSPSPAMEFVGARSVVLLRLAWLVVLVGGSAVAVGGLLGWDAGLAVIVIRNHLFAVGVSAISVTMIPAAAAWLPMAVFVAANGMYGTVDMVATPRWWALLQQPAEAPAALGTALGIAVCGCACWVWRGARAAG